MLSEVLLDKLVDALFREGEIDLGTELERYAQTVVEDEEGQKCIPDATIQTDAKEALALALEHFFSTLSEPVQEEIATAIRRYAHAPQWSDLVDLIQPDTVTRERYAIKWCRSDKWGKNTPPQLIQASRAQEALEDE